MLGCAMASEHVDSPSMLRSSTRSLATKKSCDGAATLEDCFLVNLSDKSETKLHAAHATVYTRTAKYSVYCTTSSNKKIDYVKFVSGVANVHTEYRAPVFLGGDHNGWIKPADYLSQPCGGEMKQLEVQGFVWGRSEEPCFRQSFELEARCPGVGIIVAPPTQPPRSSPTAPPTNEPTVKWRRLG